MTNLRRALLLGVLLVAFLVFAVLISFRIHDQLGRAAQVESTLVLAQDELDQILQRQIDEETGLRGFLATGQRFFLDPYLSSSQFFDDQVDAFERTTAALDVAEIPPTIADVRLLHRRWDTQVAGPLIANPSAPDAVDRQRNGKVYVDHLRADVDQLNDLLRRRLALAQDEIRRRIDETLFTGLALVIVFGSTGILFVLSRARMIARIDRVRATVETLQGAFLTDLDILPGSRIGVVYSSATRDAAVGGDLFDVMRLDDHTGLLIIGDVSGKGVEAAVNTAFVKYTIRTLAYEERDPAAILSAFNKIFLNTIKDPSVFVVAFVGLLDSSTQRLTYAGAGHGGTFLRRDDKVRQLGPSGPIVGVQTSVTFEKREVQLQANDLLVLATDGLTEARDANGNMLDDAGAMALIHDSSSDPKMAAEELAGAVRRMSGGSLRDDLAVLVIAIDGAP
jgi:serine phosphatase RsbU (regulator of sigma subunit)